MARWHDIVAIDPDLAAHVRRCFALGKHSTLATLRRDGSPRISGTEVDFADDGEIYLGMMPASRKARDLRRDPRLALHCPSVDPPESDPASWLGDAKLAGRGVEVSDPTRDDEPHRFRIDVGEVVLTTVGATGDHLVIRSWHPERGLERRERR
ncbi:MAG: pyridoxamine 5'-phosphate oxidase family protein [Actinomycetota bacterium]|nr:pyridoxamine 5'-phosphate oxidase family protein [Actinomycetota bacterium]